MSDSESELNASELGTKEYWENVYKSEKTNFEDSGDAGEIWFGLSTLRLLVKYITSAANSIDDAIIDLGCGNGVLLVELGKAGYTNLYGVDYCQDAIDLASSIAKSKGCLAQYDVCDLVNKVPSDKKYSIAVDKGTYDAISLDPDATVVEKRKSYLRNVAKMLAPNGRLILTTCNWSEKEITGQISQVEGLQFKEKLPAPEFKFGGKTGSRVTTVVYEKTG